MDGMPDNTRCSEDYFLTLSRTIDLMAKLVDSYRILVGTASQLNTIGLAEKKEIKEALRLADEKGYTFVHPFDDLEVATGQGSVAMEIIKELPTVDYILVPIGGGGLATGVSTLAKLINPNIKVIGVEPAGAACMKASLAAGEVVTLDSAVTIADGTAVKTPGSIIFPYIQKNIDEIIMQMSYTLSEALNQLCHAIG